MEVAGQTFLFAPTLTKLERQELLQGEHQLDAGVTVLVSIVEEELLERVMRGTVVTFGSGPQDRADK